MKLKLERPIVFLDLETTGIDISKDRIVEICLIKLEPNGNRESSRSASIQRCTYPRHPAPSTASTTQMSKTAPHSSK